MGTAEPRRRLSTLLRLVSLIAPHRWRFFVAAVALLLGSAVTLGYPQAARYAIDFGMRGGDYAALNLVLVALAAALALHAALVWIRHYLVSWLGERVVTDLRRMVFDRLLALPMTWFHERHTGELVGRLASDVTVIESVVGSDLSIALRNGVQLVGGLVLLLVVDWELTLWMLAVVPPFILATVFFGKVIRRMSKRVQDRLAEASADVQDALGAIQTVQSFNRERHEADRYGARIEAAFGQGIQLARWRSSFIAMAAVGGYFAIGLILWMGGRRVISGEVSPGDLTAFILYTAMVAGALANVAGLYGSLQRAAGATERLFAIIDTVPEIRDPDDPVDLPDGEGAVVFDAVDFTYPSRPEQPVLSQIDLSIAPGELVALVGPSGAGKSTMTAMVSRFFDPTGGVIRFDGVDVKQLRLADLRSAVGVVAQEPVLLAGTIRDNICYGARGEVSDEQMIAAARDANAHDFIAGFPDGYDTHVGERGVRLSGGQKQRIAIARAILADPRLLILDEATSNLDAESEAAVQQALTVLMRGRTTLLVAHRLSTVRSADRIVVLEGGRICQEGRHDELMASGGTYRRLVEHQVIADRQRSAG